jgi:hypothetical protein
VSIARLKAVQETELLRRHYLPKEVRVLFVGEFPPAGGTFFYAANSNLYFATEEAFVAALPALAGRDFLEEFQRMGCYLDDLCLEPVNRLDALDSLRVAARAEGQERLSEHMRIWRPKAIVVAMVAIAENVARAAREARLEDVQEHVLPFPGRKAHRDRYVAELVNLVTGFEAAGVLLRGGRQRSQPAK